MSRDNTKSKPFFDIADDDLDIFSKKEPNTGQKEIEKPALPNEPVFTFNDDSSAKIDLENYKEPKAKVKPTVKISQNPILESNEEDVLKKYILLKEQEIRDNKEQLTQFQNQFKKQQTEHELIQQKLKGLLIEYENTKAREQEVKQQYLELKTRYKQDIEKAKNEYEEKVKRIGVDQDQAQEVLKNRSEWKDKIKEDLNKIRLKERELENKYELLKRDTQTLLDSKDKQLLELKKKNDALELELEGMEEKVIQSNTMLAAVESKKTKLIETLKLMISMLESIDQNNSDK